MSYPTPPAPGTTETRCGDTVTAIEREEREPIYEVRDQHGIRMTHWSWEAICQCCWGWVAKTVGGRAAASAWHAGRFGRGRETFHFDGHDLQIESWAVVTDWHVVLVLEGGLRLELDRGDRVMKVWREGDSDLNMARTPDVTPDEVTPDEVTPEQAPPTEVPEHPGSPQLALFALSTEVPA